MAPGHIRKLRITRRRCSRHKALVVQGLAAEHDFPVGGTCGHIEGSRYQNQLCPSKSHQPSQFRETEVETDAEADFAELCIEDSNLTAGSQCIGLLEGLSSFDVDIKEMHLPVLCNLAAAAVEDIGGVVNVPIF